MLNTVCVGGGGGGEHCDGHIAYVSHGRVTISCNALPYYYFLYACLFTSTFVLTPATQCLFVPLSYCSVVTHIYIFLVHFL